MRSHLPKFIFVGGVMAFLFVGLLHTSYLRTAPSYYMNPDRAGGAHRHPDTADRPTAPSPIQAAPDNAIRLAMQIFISVVFMASALFVVLSRRFDADGKHWAFATLGTVIGFWLRI
jgi:hypothetical protein